MSNETNILDCSDKCLGEDDIKDCIEELRCLVKRDNKLKNFRTENEYLLRYLHCTRFQVSAAFKRMQDFTDIILENPHWFATTGPLDMKKQIERNDKVNLLIRDNQGRCVFILKLGKLDTTNSYPSEQGKIYDIWTESIMDDPKTQATGLSVIIDMKGYSWRLFKWLTPTNIMIIAKRVDLYPFKELVIHVVNTSFLLSASIKLIWPFLNGRLKNMNDSRYKVVCDKMVNGYPDVVLLPYRSYNSNLKFHFDNWSSLHEHFDSELLPAEYGGTGLDIDFEKSNQLLFDQNSEIVARLKCQLAGINLSRSQ